MVFAMLISRDDARGSFLRNIPGQVGGYRRHRINSFVISGAFRSQGHLETVLPNRRDHDIGLDIALGLVAVG